MAETVDLFVPLAELDDPLGPRLERALGWARGQAGGLRVLRRSLDARKGRALGQRLRVLVARQGEPLAPAAAPAPPPQRWPAGRAAPQVVVVGSGPAGSWAALRLAEAGVPVTIVEQGKPVQPRRHDLALLTRGQLAPSSNYCFGEGGAGTYSDGKLYTRAQGARRRRRRDRRSGALRRARPTSPSRRVRTSARTGCRRCCTALRAHLVGWASTIASKRRSPGLRARRRPRARGAPARAATSWPPTSSCWRSATRRAPVYEWAPRTRRRARAQGVRARRAHRAPAAADRRDPVRRAPPATPGCRAAFYELTQRRRRARRLQLLHVPGRLDRPRGDRGRRRRGQRHEPVAARFAVRQRGPGRHRRAPPTSAPRRPGRWRASRCSGGVEQRRASRRRRRLPRAGAAARRTSSTGAPSTRGRRVELPARAGAGADIGAGAAATSSREALRAGAARASGARMPGFLSPRPCWSASRRAPARRCACCATRTTLRVAVAGRASIRAGEGAGYAGGIVSAALDGARVARARCWPRRSDLTRAAGGRRRRSRAAPGAARFAVRR